MNKNQNSAKNLIDGLLQEAENNPDFEQWKKDHPEEIARHAAMSREEIIAEIMQNLEKLGLVEQPVPEPDPEPAQELTPEEEQAIYDAMTEEEQESFIDYCVFVEGFNRALQEIPEGKHAEEAELIRERFNLKKEAPIYLMVMGYAAGVNHGFELGCKMYDTAKAANQTTAKAEI